mmetsp:Transcript_91096/g.253647  ORF Transcript_91096/g.253647 Transcript_91096/m.253647 type:complete len:286 (+) Transcript_91096:72-929(+)
MAAALTADQSSKVLHLNGCRYATLDFTAPGSMSNGHQSSWCTFPSTWQLAPDVPEIVEEVIAKHPWGTTSLLLDGGASYGTSLSQSPGKLMKRVYITREGDKAKPADSPLACNQRILITDSWMSSSAHSWSIGRHLFTQQCFADCTVECGSETMNCHRAVLSLSPVFQRMFESNMREGLENCINITDAEPHIVKLFLQFIYIGTIPIKHEDLVPLMVLADKYEMEDLCQMTATRVVEQIDENNVIDVVKQLRPFLERPSFQPVVGKLRDTLIKEKGLLDIIIKSG